MTQLDTETKDYENPYISRAEFEEIFFASAEFARLKQHALSLAYGSIQHQPVANLPEGSHLISSYVRIQDENGGFTRFNFAMLTGGKNVANSQS